MPVYMWYRIKIVNRPCWVAIYVQYKKSEEGLWTSYADFLAMGFYDQEGTIDAAKAQAESYLAKKIGNKVAGAQYFRESDLVVERKRECQPPVDATS